MSNPLITLVTRVTISITHMNRLLEESLTCDVCITQEEQIENKTSWICRCKINNVIGRKLANRGIIKRNYREDKIKKWCDRFHNLLGKVADKEQDNVDITDVLSVLQIDDGYFTLEEIGKVKKQLREGKKSTSDNILPEILKRCNLDDIFLNFANKLLNEKFEIQPMVTNGHNTNSKDRRPKRHW